MKAKYKIHLDPTCNSLAEVTFDQLLEIKGIKRLGRTAAAARAARAKLVSARVFKGVTPTWAGIGKSTVVPLEELAAANDIDGYVKAWRAVNHLTQ